MSSNTARAPFLRDLNVWEYQQESLTTRSSATRLRVPRPFGISRLQVIAKTRKDFPERTALHLVDFEPVVLVSVAFQDDF